MLVFPPQVGASLQLAGGDQEHLVHDVDCAVGGNAIESWNDPSNDARLWDRCVGMVLPREGLRVDQVRVIYHKAADQFNDSSTFYPDPGSDYFSFYDNLGTFAARVTGSFPDVQAVYTTSRMYGGFSDRAQRGEPRSYEEGLALNEWLRENASVDGVWYGWGPYIWGPDCASGEIAAARSIGLWRYRMATRCTCHGWSWISRSSRRPLPIVGVACRPCCRSRLASHRVAASGCQWKGGRPRCGVR